MALLRIMSVTLTVVAASFVLAAAEPCSKGQVWSEARQRCALCPTGQVKFPDVAGDERASCTDARRVCGTAEIAKFGSCTKCSADQVAVDATRCAPCPAGKSKVPSGNVRSAKCETFCPHKAEVCNGIDDDCDGQIDEGLGTTTCGTGACARSVAKCSQGKLQACTPGKPKTEVCNGIDDDCDGQIDEGNVCGPGACGGEITCGKGACERTVPTCISGKRQTCKPGSSRTEVCNGIDDDCDGTVDDLPDVFCEPCNTKVPACVNGKPGSCAGVCSRPCCEDCDSKYSSMTDRLACGKNCQLCVSKDACRSWATFVTVGVAEKACTTVASRCGLLFTASLTAPGVQTLLQCFYDAYDLCTDGGVAYAKGVSRNDQSTFCRYYPVGGGSCTAQEFQKYFADRLDELCRQVSISIPVALKPSSGH